MEDLSLHILDIVQNSISAFARNILIEITDNKRDNTLVLRIVDDGSGMDKDILKKIEDPFYTTKGKKTGLGIPLLKQSAIECDGEFRIESTPGKGTEVFASFRRDHIDRKPLGDLGLTVIAIITACSQCHMRLICRTISQRGEEGLFIFDTEEIKNELEDIPINAPSVLKFIKDYLRTQLKDFAY